MSTPSRVWDLADADPVGAVTGWLAGHADLAQLHAGLATGEGRWVGTVNAPPFPRLRIAESNADLRLLRGLAWVSLTIDVFGDPDGRPGKAALSRFTVATAEVLDEMTRQPAVGGCVFTQVSADGIRWAPLPPENQPRYVLTSTCWYHPAWH